MHKYEELEKVYYRRLFFKYFVVLSVIGGVSFGGYYLYTHKEKIEEIKKLFTPVKKKVKAVKKEENRSEAITFVVPKEALNKKLPTHSQKKPVKPKPHPAPKTPSYFNSSGNEGVIQIKEKEVSLFSLEKKFKENRSYDVAVILAKRYLRKGNIKKAKYWALKANELNPQKAGSWIIFAKILLKEGKKEKAIAVLQTYIDSYGKNEEVNEFLDEIRKGN